MMSDIPEWAWKRAATLAYDDCGEASVSVIRDTSIGRAFAAYIMGHEQPLVDPLLLEARRIVEEKYRSRGCPSTADSVIGGRYDDDVSVKVALTALRRGIELSRAQV